MIREFATAALVAAGSVALAPVAHAGPDSYYLACVNAHGYNIVDTSKALLWAQIVQDEEIADVPRSRIISLLENDGADADKAGVIVDCAWKAYNNS